MTKLYLAIVFLITGAATARANLVASYTFQNTLASDVGGAPSLTAVNPLGLNGYQSAIVYGQSRTVYKFDGNANATQNAGLTLDTTGLASPTNYSLELVFQFTQSAPWRKVLDFNDRSQEAGLYVDPNSHMNLLGSGIGAASINLNTFYHLVLTNASGTNEVKVYVNGANQFSVLSNTPDIVNSGDLLRFFQDNTATSGTEFADGLVALVRLYDTVLTPAEIAQKSNNPFVALPRRGQGCK